jgi:hypothetical protein
MTTVISGDTGLQQPAGVPLPIAQGGTNAATVAAQLNSINALLNFTGIGSDQTLAIGQTAYVDVAAATTALLYTATGDNQRYEIICAMVGNSATAGNTVLSPNNTSYTNFFINDVRTMATSSQSQLSAYGNGFTLAYGMDPKRIHAYVSTKTNSKNVEFKSHGLTSTPTSYLTDGCGYWLGTASSSGAATDTTTAWNSLGTITFPVAATGRIFIKRLA